MRTLRQEMKYPLPQVERKWLRRSVTLIMAPFVLILSLGYKVIVAIAEAVNDSLEFIDDCW